MRGVGSDRHCVRNRHAQGPNGARAAETSATTSSPNPERRSSYRSGALRSSARPSRCSRRTAQLELQTAARAGGIGLL